MSESSYNLIRCFYSQFVVMERGKVDVKVLHDVVRAVSTQPLAGKRGMPNVLSRRKRSGQATLSGSDTRYQSISRIASDSCFPMLFLKVRLCLLEHCR